MLKKKDDIYDKHDDNIIDTKWMIINISQMFQYDLYMDYLLPCWQQSWTAYQVQLFRLCRALRWHNYHRQHGCIYFPTKNKLSWKGQHFCTKALYELIASCLWYPPAYAPLLQVIKIKHKGSYLLEVLKQLSNRAIIEHCSMLCSFLYKANEAQGS